MIAALCGGVGGAKLAAGLAAILPPGELSIVVNTGDDFTHMGLLICPDLDTVTYTLAGRAHPEQGWGRRDESWLVFQELERLGGDTWFRLGDRDIALHLVRRQLMSEGLNLSAATREIARRFAIVQTILPMCDLPVRTIVTSDEGDLAFQDYFVRRQCRPKVSGFSFRGADVAAIPDEVVSLLRSPFLKAIVLCPSNPFVSIGPILAVPGMREELKKSLAPVVAVSPIIDGKAVKGPAAKMMRELGMPVSSLAVRDYYGDLIDVLIVDESEAGLTRPGVVARPTLMHTNQDRMALALAVIEVARAIPTSGL